MEITLKSTIHIYIDIKSLGIPDSSRITYCSASLVNTNFLYCENKCAGECICDDAYLQLSSLLYSSCGCEDNKSLCRYKTCLETNLYTIQVENDFTFVSFWFSTTNAEAGLYDLFLKINLTNPNTSIDKTYEGIVTLVNGLLKEDSVTIKIRNKLGSDKTIVYSDQVYDKLSQETQNTLNEKFAHQNDELVDSIDKISDIVDDIASATNTFRTDLIDVSKKIDNVCEHVDDIVIKQSDLEGSISDLQNKYDTEINNLTSKFPIKEDDISQNSVSYDKLSPQVRKKIEDAYNSGGDGGHQDGTKHILLTYLEYTKIKYPDSDTIYFIYDDSTPDTPDPSPEYSVTIKENTLTNSGTLSEKIIVTTAVLENNTLKWQQ